MTELTASTSTEKTKELKMIDPKTVTATTVAISSPEAPTPSSQKKLMNPIMPVIMVTPQNTSNPVIVLDTDISPKNLETIPIVVFAD